MKPPKLWKEYQQKKLLPIKSYQDRPKQEDQKTLSQNGFGESITTWPAFEKVCPKHRNQREKCLKRMEKVSHEMIVVSAVAVGPCMVFRAMLVDMVISQMPSPHHCIGNSSHDTDQQAGEIVEPLVKPDSKVSMVVMNHLEANRNDQKQ